MQEIVENSIENLRRLRGLTQEELAQAVSVTRQTIIALEKGNYTPSVLLAMKIAQFLCVPVEKMFTIKVL